jgi:hypothetical protein
MGMSTTPYETRRRGDRQCNEDSYGKTHTYTHIYTQPLRPLPLALILVVSLLLCSAVDYFCFASWLRRQCESVCVGRCVAVLEGGYSVKCCASPSPSTIPGLASVTGQHETLRHCIAALAQVRHYTTHTSHKSNALTPPPHLCLLLYVCVYLCCYRVWRASSRSMPPSSRIAHTSILGQTKGDPFFG